MILAGNVARPNARHHHATGTAGPAMGLSGWLLAWIRSHTSQRWTGTSLSTSKPPEPPTTTACWLFLVKTNMVEPPFSGLYLGPTATPTVSGHAIGEQEHLHYGAGRERLHDCARRRFERDGRSGDLLGRRRIRCGHWCFLRGRRSAALRTAK